MTADIAAVGAARQDDRTKEKEKKESSACRETPCGLTEPSPPDWWSERSWSLSGLVVVKTYNDHGREAFLALVPDRYRRP